MNNQWFSKVAVWLVIALVLFTVFKQFERTGTQTGTIGYSDFLEEVRAKRVRSVTLQESVGGSTEIRVEGKTYCQANSYSALGNFRASASGKCTLPNPSIKSCPC